MLKKLLLALSVSAVIGAAIFTYCTPIFYKFTDKYTVYRVSASSTGIETKVNENDFPIFSAMGESFSFENGKYSKEEVFSAYSAKLVLIEKVAEGTSYYAYSDKIKRYKIIRGDKVNIQIFVGISKTTVGSPIIFGSF